MKILFCSSEVVPFAASGGLGDVAGSLPKSLNAEGQDVRVILPLYGKIKEKYSEDLKFIDSFNVSLGWRNQYCGLFTMEQNGVTYYLLDNEFYFNRPNLYGYGDDGERFAFYSKAILESLLHLDFEPDIIHANDWQSALVTLYINVYYRHIQKFQKIKTVFTIHNIAYQGQYGYDMIGIDSSPMMLTQAQEKKYEYELPMLFLCQDMTDLDLFGTIDAAVCTLDSLNHLETADDIRKTIAKVGLFMNHGGIFIFDVNTIYKHREILGNNTFVYDCDDVYCVWQNQLSEDDSVEISLDIFEYDDGAYFRESESFREIACPIKK